MERLNIEQLYRHIRDKTDTYPLHSMYDVILFFLYHDILLHKFPTICNQCYGLNSITTLSLNHVGLSHYTDITRFHLYGL